MYSELFLASYSRFCSYPESVCRGYPKLSRDDNCKVAICNRADQDHQHQSWYSDSMEAAAANKWT